MDFESIIKEANQPIQGKSFGKYIFLEKLPIKQAGFSIRYTKLFWKTIRFGMIEEGFYRSLKGKFCMECLAMQINYILM